MDRYDFEQWLQRWQNAWAYRDGHAFTALLAPDIIWQREPFADALRGHAQVAPAVEAALRALDSVEYACGALAFDPPIGIARWSARLQPTGPGIPVATDGVLAAWFDEDGRCVRLDEWWHARAEPF